MPKLSRQRLIALGGAVAIATLVAYLSDVRAGIVVLILLVGIIIVI